MPHTHDLCLSGALSENVSGIQMASTDCERKGKDGDAVGGPADLPCEMSTGGWPGRGLCLSPVPIPAYRY